MSKEHMQDMLEAFQNHGWCLLGERDHPNGNDHPFLLEDDYVTWVISNDWTQRVVELEFRAFGRLGERTHALKDIHYCHVVGTDVKFYLEKPKRPEWRQSLVQFLRGLTWPASQR